jgi:uncharacterized protein with LGFP repeats
MGWISDREPSLNFAARFGAAILVTSSLVLANFSSTDTAYAGPTSPATGSSLAHAIPSTTALPMTLSASSFRPGMIISDSLFYNGAAMSSAEIQSFLDGKVGVCQNGKCLNVATIAYPGRAREVSSKTGNLICEAIPAGTVLASELIYRAQVACGISAKVILVTLQKEQSLVTNSAPTDYALRWAMGMACPDTAACDTAFAGLGTQIVTGTRQLKVYRAAAFMRQPGQHFIGWHPNSECGGTILNIENFATAALYNYTPYQPNAAALANLRGIGDLCSSYGNRNFWRFYNEWFGPTIDMTGEIAVYYATGSNATRLGSPTGASSAWTAGGVTGELQYFELGIVLSSASTGTFSVLNGVMRDAWGSRGGSGGSLGWPTGDQVAMSGGLRQQYQRGTIFVPTGGASVVLSTDIANYWTSGSNVTRLGVPTASVSAWAAGGVQGSLQGFQRGIVLSSPTTGTFAVLDGVMRAGWGAQSGSGGPLGWPTSDQAPWTAGGVSGVIQYFQRGMVMSSPTTGTASVLSGVMRDAWGARGGSGGVLGWPTGDQLDWTAGGVSGVLQNFHRGMLLSSPTTGSYAVLNGVIRQAWGSRGGSGGALGWPTGDQEAVEGGIRQQFQRGVIFVPTGGTSVVLSPEIGAYWVSGSNLTRLGLPAGSSSDWTAGGVSGTLQYFQKGLVLSSPTTGTYSVLNGPMRLAWGAQGGSGGTLGWPTGDQETVGSEFRQQFQRGTLVVPAV